MRPIQVRAHRRGGWWALEVTLANREVWTQCRRLDQAEAVAREAASMSLNRSLDGRRVVLEVQLDAAVGSVVEDTVRASAAAASAQAVSSQQSRCAVRELRERGYSVRDCAYLLGLSPTRVSQLLSG